MVQLLYPIGLIAGIGILLPFLVHLWKINSGKTLKIGSVAFLNIPSNQQSRSLKINNWPLMLLRCLLILLIAFLLARPSYNKALASSAQKGWILVEKANLNKLWKIKRKQLDSLLLKGYEIHDFDLGFARLQPEDSITRFFRSAKKPLSYYDLLKQLDTQEHQGRKLYLFTDNHLSRFAAKKPILNLDIHWTFLPKDSTAASWVADAYETNEHQVIQINAHSTSGGTYFSAEDLKSRNVDDFPVDTAGIKVQIYQAHVTIDAQFVKAALLALRQYTNRKIQVSSLSSANQISDKARLVFWLSEQPPSAADLRNFPKGATLFQYAGSQAHPVSSTIQDEMGTALEHAELYKRTEMSDAAALPVWVDAYGHPILTVNDVSGVKQYKFYSRFKPEWNNLVWTSGMTLFLTPIILPSAAAERAFHLDQRSLNALNVATLPSPKKNFKGFLTRYVSYSLSPTIWWLIFILFFLERWLSYRKNTQEA